MNAQNSEPKYVFKPLYRFMYKMWLYLVLIWTAIFSFVSFMGWVIATSSDGGSKEFGDFGPFLWQLFFLGSIIYFLIGFVSSYIYTATMEFYIYHHEVVVKKGVVNKTEKHVPYRTVTNISTRYGVFDKLFGIGTVEIETAGKSGQATGPEEKIEGIPNFNYIRDVILDELRKFRSQYATGTEIDEIVPDDDSSETSIKILNELRAIKDLLATQN